MNTNGKKSLFLVGLITGSALIALTSASATAGTQPEEYFTCFCYEKITNFFGSCSRGKIVGYEQIALADVMAGEAVKFCDEEFPGSMPGVVCTAPGDAQ